MTCLPMPFFYGKLDIANDESANDMTAIAETKPRRPRPLSARNIPAALIYEMWQGKPVYYKGYRDVLAGKQTVQGVRAVFDFKGALCSLISGYLGNLLNRQRYLFAVNTGLHLTLNDNLGNDLVIFEKEKVGKLKGKYFDVPPKIVIEVDIKADTTEFENGADGYVMRKAQKILDFGVEKVLWIITGMQRVYVIDRDDPTWRIVDWSENIIVLDDCVLNIKQLLDDEEITY